MKKPSLHNQSGQLIVESVLIIVVLMGVVFATSTYFKSQDTLQSIISTPWQNLAGMLQNGSWGTPAATFAVHPSAHGRHISIDGGD